MQGIVESHNHEDTTIPTTVLFNKLTRVFKENQACNNSSLPSQPNPYKDPPVATTTSSKDDHQTLITSHQLEKERIMPLGQEKLPNKYDDDHHSKRPTDDVNGHNTIHREESKEINQVTSQQEKY
eukprot:15330866-Ditylum_brightwellii.AAC.1